MRQLASSQEIKITPLRLFALCSVALWCAVHTPVAANPESDSATELSEQPASPGSAAFETPEPVAEGSVPAPQPSQVYDNELESQIKEGERERAKQDVGPARKTPEAWHWDWIHKQDHWGFEGRRFVGKFGLLGMKLGARLMVDTGLLSQRQSLDLAAALFGWEASLPW